MRERIVVVGSSGAGKTTFADTLAKRLGHARLELDAVHHMAGWQPRPTPDARVLITEFLRTNERWIIDGNFSRYRDLVWADADTIVWLDLNRPAVMRRLLRRTVLRLACRVELWNGNHERWSNLTSLDPERSVIAWSWTHHLAYRREYGDLMMEVKPGRTWVRLCTPGEVRRCGEFL